MRLRRECSVGAELTPLSRLHLARWLFAYHLGMAVSLPLGERVRSFPLHSRGGARLRCHFRWHASDLHVLREVFASQAYALPAEAMPADVKTVVDLGSNIGLSSLHFSMLFPAARVVCVEPVADSAEILRIIAERNGVDWRIEEAAIAAQEGTTICTRTAGGRRVRRHRRRRRPESRSLIAWSTPCGWHTRRYGRFPCPRFSTGTAAGAST